MLTSGKSALRAFKIVVITAVLTAFGPVRPSDLIDADMALVLETFAGLHVRPIESLTPEEARRQPTAAQAAMAVLAASGGDTSVFVRWPRVESTDLRINARTAIVSARLYRPAGPGPFPVILYFHGGGWVTGNLDAYDGAPRGLAQATNAVVVSMEYRLAPEHKFPAQHEDALEAWRWVHANISLLNGDLGRAALAGEGAGGNLALATAIAARDLRLPLPRHVLAIYPITRGDTISPSYDEHADALPLSRARMGWYFNHVARTPADLRDPRINLVGARLRGLPPVTVITAELDPLRSDGELLVAALRRAAVNVEWRNYAGVTHEFFGMAPVVRKAEEAQRYAARRLNNALAHVSRADY